MKTGILLSRREKSIKWTKKQLIYNIILFCISHMNNTTTYILRITYISKWTCRSGMNGHILNTLEWVPMMKRGMGVLIGIKWINISLVCTYNENVSWTEKYD